MQTLRTILLKKGTELQVSIVFLKSSKHLKKHIFRNIQGIH